MPLGGRNSASLHQAFRGLAFAASLGWALSLCAAVPAQAGYAIHEMVGWAQWVTELQRGPVDIANPAWGTAGYGAEADVLGPAAGDNLTVLSLGDGGFITLEFDPPIGNGPGDDFAVFENGFYDNATGELFGEFAFVEVSSNGVDFARFATETTAPTAPQESFARGARPAAFTCYNKTWQDDAQQARALHGLGGRSFGAGRATGSVGSRRLDGGARH